MFNWWMSGGQQVGGEQFHDEFLSYEQHWRFCIIEPKILCHYSTMVLGLILLGTAAGVGDWSSQALVIMCVGK
jgi:hypothetical protein